MLQYTNMKQRTLARLQKWLQGTGEIEPHTNWAIVLLHAELFPGLVIDGTNFKCTSSAIYTHRVSTSLFPAFNASKMTAYSVPAVICSDTSIFI